MQFKIKQKAILISNSKKVSGIEELNKFLDDYWIVRSTNQYPETGENYGGTIYILEKNEAIKTTT